MRISKDIFYAKARRIMVKPKPVDLPSQWVLSLYLINEGIDKSYGFPAKPTRKQIKEKIKDFISHIGFLKSYN